MIEIHDPDGNGPVIVLRDLCMAEEHDLIRRVRSGIMLHGNMSGRKPSNWDRLKKWGALDWDTLKIRRKSA